MNVLEANINNIAFCLAMRKKRAMGWYAFLTGYLPSGLYQFNRGRANVCGGYNARFWFGGE